MVQMVLGAAGFVAAFGRFDLWPWAAPATRDPLAWLALILVSAFLFNIGGVLWLAVPTTYRPKPAAPAARTEGRPASGVS